MNLIFALSPLLAVGVGALLLMLAEALGKPALALDPRVIGLQCVQGRPNIGRGVGH